MTEGASRERAERVAAAVLGGKRHRAVGKAMFFHTAGRTYRYSNMHYVLVAGGNAFYERRPTRGRSYIPRTVIASAGPTDSITPRGGWRDRRPDSMPEQMLAAAPTPAPRQARAPEPVFVAAAPPPTPRPQPVYAPAPVQAPVSIESLILADAGF